MKPFILMFYLWTPSQNAGATVTMIEFSSIQSCEAAGKVASDKFSGFLSKASYLCVPKDAQ